MTDYLRTKWMTEMRLSCEKMTMSSAWLQLPHPVLKLFVLTTLTRIREVFTS